MNTARSALSSIMVTSDLGLTFGGNPLVKRFLRGIFNIKPSIPKHVCVYDVDIVLRYLKSIGEAESVPFKLLTFRLATLYCLLSAQRDQTIASIDVRDMHVTENRVICYISKSLKTTRPGFHQSPLDFQAFPECKSICPVFNTCQYLKQSFSLRGPLVALFISYNFPFRPVCTSTISRWVKATLKLAGIDTKVFTSHSTRAASTMRSDAMIPKSYWIYAVKHAQYLRNRGYQRRTNSTSYDLFTGEKPDMRNI